MCVLGLAFERRGLFGGTLKREDCQEEEDQEHGEEGGERGQGRERKRRRETGSRKQDMF